jgi:hypothetical protein
MRVTLYFEVMFKYVFGDDDIFGRIFFFIFILIYQNKILI